MGITVCWHFIFHMITIKHYPWKHRFSFENTAQAESKQNLKMGATLRIWTSNVNENLRNQKLFKRYHCFQEPALGKNSSELFLKHIS